MMKSPYPQVLNGTHGHCIHVEADTPIWIPPVVIKQAIAQGLQHCDAEAPTKEVVVAPVETSDNGDNDVFDVALDQAILRILSRNDPADYKPDNTPKVLKVVSEMAPELRRPTATEVSDAFQRLQENIDLAE
jgi:hypothetical protein